MVHSKSSNDFLITISAPKCYPHSYGHCRGCHKGHPNYHDGKGLKSVDIIFWTNYFTKQLKHTKYLLMVQETNNSSAEEFHHLHVYIHYIHLKQSDNIRKSIVNLKNNPQPYYCPNQYRVQTIETQAQCNNSINYCCKSYKKSLTHLFKGFTHQDLLDAKAEYKLHLQTKHTVDDKKKCLSKFILHEFIHNFITINKIHYDSSQECFISVIQRMTKDGYNMFNLRGNVKWVHALLNDSFGDSSDFTSLLSSEFHSQY